MNDYTEEKRIAETLLQLKELGFLGQKDFAEGKLFLASRGQKAMGRFHSWEAIAQKASTICQYGVFFSSAHGMTYVNGRNYVWVSEYPYYGDIVKSRAICKKFTKKQDPPYSITGCGRRMIRHTGVRQDCFTEDTSKLIWSLEHNQTIWHYRHCVPVNGIDLTYWDVKACYYSILARMKSPILSLRKDNSIIWHPLPKEKRLSWDNMVYLIGEVKPLRNSMIGGMWSAGGSMSFSNGKRIPSERKEGPISAAAALIVHTAYKLCQEVCENNNVWLAATDGAATESPTIPPIQWTSRGLQCEIKDDKKTGAIASGMAHIESVQSYRIGDYMTTEYKKAMDARARKEFVINVAIPETSPNIVSSYHHWIDRV